MGENVPADSETLKLVLPNTVDPSDNESGIGSCQSDEDLHLLTAYVVSEPVTPIKPKRVQFQTAENLVLIREIPPRGFYGSDVSDTDSGADEVENDHDEGTDDEEDDKDSEGQQSSSDDQDESDSSSDSEDNDDDTDEKPRTLLIKTPVTTGSYSVEMLSGRSVEKISKITSMALLPQSSSVLNNRTVTQNEKKTQNVQRKYRNKKTGNNSNIKNPHRVLVADGKKRKNSTKTSNLMKSTSSSRNKEKNKKPSIHTQSASPMSHKKQILNKEKSAPKISIDSLLQTSNRINSTLYFSQTSNRRTNSGIKVYNSVRPYSATASLSYASCLGTSRDKQAAHLPRLSASTGIALKTYPTHKQYNAWQVANGNLDGRNLHTPSIAPMWENVHILPSGKQKSKNL